jgi:ferredoxin
MDHEFAHLVETYMAEGGAAGIMRPQPAIHRVVPAQNAVKSEWILPYDDVKAVLEASTAFGVRRCICRIQQEHIGRHCDFPVDICMNFSSRERSPRPNDISKEEALELLAKAEKIGLVHTVSNVMEGFGYVCNCCACCCGILRGITEYGIDHSVAYANYYATIDDNTCTGCGVCVTRCQVKATSLDEGIAVVDQARCIGCGLCATGCPTGAAQLQLKPDDAIVHPPKDFETWEDERLINRGIG